MPWRVKYPIELLLRFLEEDPDPVVAFYGGEPLLNPDFMKRVMDAIPRARFVVQTNGLLVRELEPQYWRRFDAVLLSIDGRKEVTDYYRGRGVYRAVVSAAKWLRGEVGFQGDLIARMAVSERSDIYAEVTHLLSLGLFDHVHWQLDVVWSDRWADFDKWVERSYKPGLARLAALWADKLKEGTVLGIAPFKAVAYSALTRTPLSSPPCGSGVEAFAICTDGRVLACPIAVYEDWATVGHVGSCTIRTVRRVRIGEPCTRCEYFRFCGGRCLYAYVERLWGEEGFKKVCEVTKYTIELVVETVPLIRKLVAKGVLKLEDIAYPPFNNTVEIIP